MASLPSRISSAPVATEAGGVPPFMNTISNNMLSQYLVIIHIHFGISALFWFTSRNPQRCIYAFRHSCSHFQLNDHNEYINHDKKMVPSISFKKDPIKKPIAFLKGKGRVVSVSVICPGL